MSTNPPINDPVEKADTPHLPDPFFASVNETKRLLNLGHTRVYQLMSAGELEKVKDGGKTQITYPSIRRYAAKLVAKATAA